MLKMREQLRSVVRRAAPGLIANRARRFERGVRESLGVTRLAEHLVAEGHDRVSAGPFEGLRYPTDRLAEVDAPVAKLVGVYEHELAEIFSEPVGTFVDIGSADGYYAVGVPLAHPGAQTWAFDISSSARDLCQQVADLNGTSDRVAIFGAFAPDALDGLSVDLLLCDIEGGERDFFTPDLVARLASTRVVIEIHEHLAPGAHDRLVDLFSATHVVRRINQRRPPRVLTDWSPEDRAAALNEGRHQDLWWLDIQPS